MERGLEGSGKVPRIVHVMYFKGLTRQQNQQPEAGLPQQQWETQWQEFLNTLQPSHTGWGNFPLTDMAPWNDAQAFLMAFEQVAEACQWPREEWVRQLLPALRGGMEQSFCRLDARDRTDYVKVKAAILRADALRMEMKRQHFRQCCYQELEGPRRVYGQLQDLCRQWLKPDSHTKEQILEMIIQEQLLGMLPAEAQNWVRECGPKDCVEMVALAEEFLMSHRHTPRTCDWQVPLPESSVSSLEPEGRQRQHYPPGASEVTPTRTSALAPPSSSAGLEMAETGTTEEPVRVKEESDLEEKPIHWEVMRGNSAISSALEGLLVPTPEVNSQADQPSATFQERPEHGDQIPDALFGGRIIGEIKIETFQRAMSDAEDDFEALQEEGGGGESWGAPSLNPESSPLDPGKPLGAKQQEEVEKKKCIRRRRRTIMRKTKYYPPEKKHVCPECGHKSYYYSDLLRHMKCHEAKEQFECLECGKTYRGRSYFENHQKTHLPLDDPNRRGRTAGTRNAGDQMKEKYICFTCGVVKSSPSGLAEHMKVHTGERAYQCLECGKLFKWQSNLCRHRRLHTNRRFSSRQLMGRGEEESRSTCPLQKDIKLEEEAGAYPPSDDQLSPAASQEEGQAATEASEHRNMKMHTCTKCGYQAEKLPDILKHFRVHNKEKPYRYLDCGNSFGWSSTLTKQQQSHEASQQTPVPNVVVAECDVTLSDDEELINFLGKKPPRQESGVHNGSKRSSKRSPAAAPSSAASRLKASLPLRSKEWNRKGKPAGRVNEVKKNRYDGMEKKHECLDCGHRTYYLSDLVRHKRVHAKGKPYKCPDCEKIFVQPSFLKAHLKMHKTGGRPMKRLKAPQGERKYTCSKCGHKTYKLSTHLLHVRTHVGESEKSYICDECGKCFKRSSNLSKHKQTHLFNKGIDTNEGIKIRRPSFTMDKEINRGYEAPKKTTQVPLKKTGDQSPASTTSNMAVLRKHWRNYKRQQRKKAAEKLKMEESAKENIGAKEETKAETKEETKGETKEETKGETEEETKGETKEETKEEKKKETGGKHTLELSLRARLEKFAYSKNRGKEDSQEARAPDPKVSVEELHQLCTECGKIFTSNGQPTDPQNLDTEAKSHRCNECQK